MMGVGGGSESVLPKNGAEMDNHVSTRLSLIFAFNSLVGLF